MLPKIYYNEKITLLLLCTFLAIISNAQLSWYAGSGTTTSVADINICDDTTYSIYCINPTASALTAPSLDIQLPNNVQYIPGSIQLVGTSVAVTEGNISNLSHPVFAIATIPANGAMVFTYRVKALCGGAANSVQVPIVLTYNGNVTSSPNLQGAGLAAVNINSASINIVAATNQSFVGNVGQSFTQTITLRNAGLGYMRLNRSANDNYVRVLLDSTSCLTITNPSIGTISLDTLIIPLNTISGLLTGDNDQLWENNEDLVVSYTVNINCCNNSTRNIVTQWGCDASICNTGSSFFANVSISNLAPVIVEQYINSKIGTYDVCFNNGLNFYYDTVRYINTGSGPATDLRINFVGKQNDNEGQSSLIDTTDVQYQIGFNNTKSNISPINRIIKEAGSYPNACRPPNTSWRADYIIPYLGVGDTLIVYLKMVFPNIDCIVSNNVNSCSDNLDTDLKVYRGTQTIYKDQCGSSTYTNPIKDLYISKAFGALGSSLPPSQVLGGDSFDYCLNANFLMDLNYMDNGKFRFGVILPTEFALNGNVSSYISNSLVPYPVSNTYQNGDTLFIEFDRASGNQELNNDICIPLIFNCGPGTGSSLPIKKFLEVKKTTTLCADSKWIKTACLTTDNINVICPTPCPLGGMTGVKTEFKRISFGLPDNDNDGYADNSGVIDMNKVYVKRLAVGDTLSFKWTGKVSGGNANTVFPFSYVDIDYGANANIFNAPYLANATIYPNANPNSPIVCSNLTITNNSGTYSVNVGGNCYNTFSNNDSVIVEVFVPLKKYVNNSNLEVISGGEVLLISPQTSFYTSPIASPVSSTDKYMCLNLQDNFQYKKNIFAHGINDQSISGCNGSVSLDASTYHAPLRWQLYEWKNYGVVDVMKIKPPVGFTIANVQYFAFSYITGTSPGISMPVTMSGDTVLIDTKSAYVPFGGTLKVPTEGEYSYYNFDLVPNCSTPAGTYSYFYDYTIKGFDKWDTTSYKNQFEQNGFSNNVTYTAPSINLAGGNQIVNINTQKAELNLQLQNLSNSVESKNNWIYLTIPNGNIVIDSVEIDGVATAPTNGFYHMGDLIPIEQKDIIIFARSISCDTGKIYINYGWGCTNYPNSILNSTCSEIDTLTIIKSPSGTDAQLNILTNNGLTTNFCSPFEVEMVLNSTQLGDIATLGLDYVLPSGMNYVANSAMVQYPINTAYRVASNQTAITANQSLMNIDVNNLDSLLNDGITGSYAANDKTVKIKIQLTSQCGAASGDIMNAYYNSVSACGEVLPIIEKASNPIVFTEAVVPAYTTTPAIAPDKIDGCSAANIYTADVSIAINQITGPSQSFDSIYVTLPPGALFNSYNPALSGQMNQPIVASPNGPVDLGNGRLRYSWPMTGGLSSGNIDFKFTYTFDYAQYTSCSQLLKSFIVTTGSISKVLCGIDTCDLLSINGRGEGDMNIKMPSLQGSIQTANCTYTPAVGSTVSNPLDVVINNTGTGAIASGTITRVDLYCDSDNSGTITPGDNVLQQVTTTEAIPAGGSVTINNVVITYTDITCASKKVLVKISRMPSVGTEQCVCEQPATNFVCIETPLPVIGIKFNGIPKEVGNLLTWNVTQELNFSHYELERSTDNQLNYKTISTVKGTNAVTTQYYSYLDKQPNNKEYYRLRMVDIDGKNSYSETIFLNREKVVSENLYIYPNPVSNELNVVCYGAGTESYTDFTVLDIVGKVLMTEHRELKEGINTLKLNTTSLSSGNYILHIKNSESDQTEYVKFSK